MKTWQKALIAGLLLVLCIGVVSFKWNEVKEHTHYPYTLAVLAIFQNDAPYLKEWIEFHRLVGVEHFVLINNLSTDNYLTVLRPYLQSGYVELINWPAAHNNLIEWNRLQCRSYECGLKHLEGKAKWVAVIDTDEFLFPTQESDLKEVLKQFDNQAGIGVNWRIFGTSHIYKIPDNRLMIETLQMCTAYDDEINRHIKSIVRPEYVKKCRNPHYFIYKNGYSQVDTEGVPFEDAFSPEIRFDKLQINHYCVRDEHYFQTVKLPRYAQWGRDLENSKKLAESYNQTKDLQIQRFVPLLK